MRGIMKRQSLIPYYIYIMLLVMAGCAHHPEVPKQAEQANRLPEIYPDYTNVVIPCNIAPLNFMVDDAEECVAQFSWEDGKQTYGYGNKVQIPLDEWNDILDAAKGKDIRVEVYTKKKEEKWQRFNPFHIKVAPEEIDPYISYRLISPSYIAYEMLSINQRNLTNFDESVIYNNMLVSNEEKGQCINCHAYQNYQTDNMQFHMRQGYGGTIIVEDGKPRKMNLKTGPAISAGVYPAWHPTHKLIAYSTNLTGQSFHTKDLAKIEVQDTESDLILFDVEKNEVSTISAWPNELEVYPWWAPDGNSLYYASAHFLFSDSLNPEADAINRYQDFKYDLYCRPFNLETKKFGKPELVYSASTEGKSATLPRISPDGKYMLFAMGEWGCFHIWHPDADLYLTNLSSKETRRLDEINSPQAESYHSWSSNGRWIILSSRRDDNNYTRLYIAYFDTEGNAHKAFAVPQKDPEYYRNYLRSYNIPEFMIEPVSVTPHEFAKAAKEEAVNAQYVERRTEDEIAGESKHLDGVTSASIRQ